MHNSLNSFAQLNMVDYRAFHRYPFLSPTLDGTNTHSTVDCPTQDMQSGKNYSIFQLFPRIDWQSGTRSKYHGKMKITPTPKNMWNKTIFDQNSKSILNRSELNIKKESEVAQSCLTLCDPMDCSLPGSSVHGIFQAIVLEWAAISFSRGSSQPRDRTRVSRTAGRHFTV